MIYVQAYVILNYILNPCTFFVTVDGICTLAAGTYDIAFKAGACPSYGIVDALACWGSACSIVVSEVELTDNNGEIMNL